MEENKEINESETIKIIKEEYEKKLEEQKKFYEDKIETINKNNAENIRAIVSGRQEPPKEIEEKEEKSFFDLAVEETKNYIKNGGI